MLETETITGLHNKVITRTYDTEDVPGRPTELRSFTWHDSRGQVQNDLSV